MNDFQRYMNLVNRRTFLGQGGVGVGAAALSTIGTLIQYCANHRQNRLVQKTGASHLHVAFSFAPRAVIKK